VAFVKIKAWSGIVDTGELISGLNKLKNLIEFWLERLSKAGSLASDTEEQGLRKAVLIFLAVIYTIAGVVWGFGYLLLGLPVSGSIPLSYSFISAASLLYFFKTKHYKFFCHSQLALILILPFLLQWSLGGLSASGAVVLWSILSPIGALMFAGTTRSIPWFIAYALLMVISGLQSGSSSWQQATLPNTLVVFSFVMNIGGVSEIDKPNNSIRWVSAGHEPGMIYDPAKDSFSDLNGGNNLALGVFEDSDFKEAQREVAPGQIIVIATDGIWEARNPKGEMFSKDRIHKIIRRNATKSANDIQNSVLDALKRFQKDVKLEDDMTLVVIKITR
jgi:hypothetical protein